MLCFIVNETLKNTLLKASETYDDEIILRAAIKAIPQIGGPLDMLLSGAGAKMKRQRLAHFVSELSERLETVEAAPPLDEDSLYDLVMYAIEQSVRTRKKAKRDLFANVLARYVVESREADEIEMALRVVSELDEIHFEILRLALEAPVCGGPFSGLRVVSIGKADDNIDFERLTPLNLNKHIDKWPEEMIPLAASELVSKALLFDEGSQRWDPKPLKYLVATDTAHWLRELIVNQDSDTTAIS